MQGVSSPTAEGTYGPGDTIDIAVTFSETVLVTGTPTLEVETGETDRQATYHSGSNTATLTFRYTVQPGDFNRNGLDYTGTDALALPGSASIKDADNNDAVLTLPTVSFGDSIQGGTDSKTFRIGPPPEIVSPKEGAAPGRPTFEVRVDAVIIPAYTETIWVRRFDLDGSSCPVLADASSGRAVASVDAPMAGTHSAAAFRTTSQGTYCFYASFDVFVSAPVKLTIDETAPTVESVSSTTADGTYGVGDTIDLTVTFSETVVVTGMPTLELETGDTDRVATYQSGSDSATLTFRYTVQTGDSSSILQYHGTDALTLPGSATIKDAADNDAVLTLPSPGALNSLTGAPNAKDIRIDGTPEPPDTTAPTVESVSSPTADGDYVTGDTIDITVTFSEVVVVTGNPTFELETGATDRLATYQSGSDTDILTFRYTVQAGDYSIGLQYHGTDALALPGSATIKDAADNDAVLTLPSPGALNSLTGAPNAKNFRINPASPPDNISPTVKSLSSPTADGTYGPGDTIDITVTFSEVVVVTGNPTLELETGATDRLATYQSGSDTDTLTFRYTVQAGDYSRALRYTGTDALALPGSATIKDAADNDAVLTLPTPGSANALNGGANAKTFRIGPRPVIVSTSLDSALPGRPTFEVRVHAQIPDGQTPTLRVRRNDLTGTDCPALPVGTGRSVASMNITAAGTHSLASTVTSDGTYCFYAEFDDLFVSAPLKLELDGTAPTVDSLSSPTADGSYSAGERIDITVTFSETVLVTGTPTLELETGATDRLARYQSGSNSDNPHLPLHGPDGRLHQAPPSHRHGRAGGTRNRDDTRRGRQRRAAERTPARLGELVQRGVRTRSDSVSGRGRRSSRRRRIVHCPAGRRSRCAWTPPTSHRMAVL